MFIPTYPPAIIGTTERAVETFNAVIVEAPTLIPPVVVMVVNVALDAVNGPVMVPVVRKKVPLFTFEEG